MAGSKNLYNSSAMECAIELLWRVAAVKFDPAFVDQTLTYIDAETSRLTTVAKANATDGRIGIYSGTHNFFFTKTHLGSILPPDIVYGGIYPVTWDQLKNYLRASYDLLVEHGEYHIFGDLTQKKLLSGDVLAFAPNETGRVVLQVNESNRWHGGGFLPIKITSLPLDGLDPLLFESTAIAAASGSAYDFTYVVSGGALPYTYTLVSGLPLAPWDDTLQKIVGTVGAPGIYTWRIRVTDARGFSIEKIEQVNAV